jgi:hypothetical protein
MSLACACAFLLSWQGLLFHQLPSPVSLRYLTDFRKIAPPALRFHRYARHNLDLVGTTRCRILRFYVSSFREEKPKWAYHFGLLASRTGDSRTRFFQ